MDKDRINGVARQARGTIKVADGKVPGDAKRVAEGKSDIQILMDGVTTCHATRMGY